MGRMRGQRCRSGVVGLALALALAGTAGAEVSTERSASILVFPKVRFDGTFDTIIQISNTSNSIVYGHCFYVDASLTNPELPPGPNNPPQWQEVDFDIVLTKQQPTHWVVSEGRVNNPFDPSCRLQGTCVDGVDKDKACPAGSAPVSSDCPGSYCSNVDCNDAGFDPGRIPPVSPGFIGELKCIEVDQSGAPISGNHLKGEATLLSTIDSAISRVGDASKYNAIGVIGLDTNDSNTKLCLGGGATGDCPAGAEYVGCPDSVLISHYADGAANPVVEEFGNGKSQVVSELTLVPCRQDFETQTAAKVVVQFLIYNEFETRSSTSTTVDCWGNFRLGELPIFTVQTQLSRFLQTYARPASTGSGFVGVLEEFHTQPDNGVARSAQNLHVVGERPFTDLVIIPEGP